MNDLGANTICCYKYSPKDVVSNIEGEPFINNGSNRNKVLLMLLLKMRNFVWLVLILKIRNFMRE